MAETPCPAQQRVCPGRRQTQGQRGRGSKEAPGVGAARDLPTGGACAGLGSVSARAGGPAGALPCRARLLAASRPGARGPDLAP